MRQLAIPMLALVGLSLLGLSGAPAPTPRLVRRPAPSAARVRSAALSAPSGRVRSASARPLRPAARELSLLAQLAAGPTDAARRAALLGLLELDQRRPLCEAAMNQVARALARAADPQRRAAALLILNRRRSASLRTAALLDQLQRDPSPLVRSTAAWGVGQLGGPPLTLAQQRQVLERLGLERDASVRLSLADSLLQRGVARPALASRGLLEVALRTEPGRVREKLLTAYRQLRG